MTKEEVENKFSVGTRVKLIEPWTDLQQFQEEMGTVLEIITYSHGTFLIIDWDNIQINFHIGKECFPWRFEVVEAKATGTGGSSVCP